MSQPISKSVIRQLTEPKTKIMSMSDTTRIPITPLASAKKDLNAIPKYKRRFHAMTKPIGALCNIDCQYCFYLHKEDLLFNQLEKKQDQQEPQQEMSDELLENYIKQYIESQDHDQIVFSWQGGEPTLLGVPFFKKVVALQQKYCPNGVSIENDLQTNGILLNDEWGHFLKEHHFLVGLSIDGPRDLHDKYRVTRSGKPTFDLVMKGVHILKKYQIPFNALVTINRHNAKYPIEVYNFLTIELNVTYIQFNPCVEPKDFKTTAPQFWNDSMIPIIGTPLAKPGHPMSVVTDWSVDPDDWGNFLKATFEIWVNNDLGRVLVNLFETAVAQTMGLDSQLCITAEFCGKGIAVEKDGSVYSCDHYVYPEYQLGNIDLKQEKPDQLANLVFSQRQQAFGLAKKETLPTQCKQCSYLTLCWGECPKNRLIRSKNNEVGLNYLCSGITSFFDYAQPILQGIATLINKTNKT